MRSKKHTRFWFIPLSLLAVVWSTLVVAQEDDEDDEPMETPSMDFDFGGESLDLAPRYRMQGAPAPQAGGTASVTAGGAQDIRHARQIIGSGGIPSADSMVAEGLLSEHDLPVRGPACERIFCPLFSTGYAPSFDSERGEIWAQLGFNSNIDIASFRRRPLNTAIVLDRSGSMGGEKMEVVRAAALAMLARMDENDRLALVSYASTPEVDLHSSEVDRAARFERIINGWATGGATNLEGALDLGYREVARHAGEAGYENRVIVFTDMLPNVGITGPESFEGMASRWAVEGINLTVIGVGTDFGQQLGLTLAELRGGNYFFLRDREEAGRVFGEELDFMVTPVAFDVEMAIEAAPGFELTGVYGVPEPEDGRIASEIATLFLSNKGGAIVMRFIPSDASRATWRPETPIAQVTLSYTDPSDDREEVSAVATFAMPTFEPDAPMFEQTGPHRAWALVQQSLIMRQAIADHQAGNAELADGRLSDLEGTLRAVAELSDDESMSEEAALVAQLRENLRGN